MLKKNPFGHYLFLKKLLIRSMGCLTHRRYRGFNQLQIEGSDIIRDLPNSKVLFVSNHQSTYDIPPLIWYLRKYAPKFVAKKELGKGIPSISYHLRKGGNVLIDRKNSIGALKAIKKFSKKVYENRWSVVIFPEGTRSRNGQTKHFHQNGLEQLLHEIPDALIIPISINNSWKLAKWNYFPIPLGVQIELNVHPPIDPQNSEIKRSLEMVEKTIIAGVKN